MGGWLAHPEIGAFGFYMPWGLVIGALGFLVAWAVLAVMQEAGWTRHVWNLPLFFAGLVVLTGCVLGLLLAP